MTHFTVTSPHVSPRAFLAALTDFSEQRFPFSPAVAHADRLGSNWAVVTEGSRSGVWSRVHYDWSQPGVVMIRVLASNAFAAGSFRRYDIRTATGGGSRITVSQRTFGKTVRGKWLAAIENVLGARALRNNIDKMLRTIAESREHYVSARNVAAPLGGGL